MPTLQITTLGGLNIYLDGSPVTGLRSRKAEALLVYLAANPGAQPRPKLAEMLWEDRPHAQSLSNLRVILANLRKELAPYLHITRDAAAMNPGSPWTYDAARFDTLLAQGQIGDALALYRGDFLDGFYLRGARGFERWQSERRRYYQQQVRAALRAQIQTLETQHDPEAALPHARRLVNLDPFDETAQMTLLRLLARTNRRGEAIRHYQGFRRQLAAELDARPSAEIEALFRRIQAGDSVTAPAAAPAPELPPYLQVRRAPAQPAALFVGRERALVRLHARLDQALDGRGGMLFVTGEAGSGKTALAQAFIRRAQTAHRALLAVTGHSHLFTGAGDPFGPWREVLDALTGEIEPRWAAGEISQVQAARFWHSLPVAVETLAERAPALVGTLLPRKTLAARVDSAGLRAELAPALDALPQDPPSQPQNALYRQYADFLTALAARFPLLITLEDLQWADPSTLGFLSYLASRLPASRILLLGTYRTLHAASGEPGAPNLPAVLREFKRQFGDIWIDLDRYNPAEGEAFVRALLDARLRRVDPVFARRLARHTGGHPLFVVELLENLQRQDPPSITRAAPGSVPQLDWDALPARVEAVIEMRLSRLAPPASEILKTASVIGEEFRVDVLTRALEMDADRVAAALDHLLREDALLVEGGRAARLRFRHVLFQRYLYGNLTGPERVSRHRRVGLALEAVAAPDSTPSDTLTLQLAHHFTEARMPLKAGRYLLEAGNRAVQMGAHAEAIGHFRKGIALLERAPRTQERLEMEISLSLAMYAPLQALRGYADPELAALGQRVETLCDQVDAENPLLSSLYFLRVTHKTPREREIALQKARHILADTAQSDPLLLALAHWTLGAEESYRGEFVSARGHLEQATALYNRQEHPWSAFLFGNDPGISSRARLAWVLWFLGYPEQAVQVSEQALAMAEELDNPVVMGFAIGIGGVLFNQIRRDLPAMTFWNLESIRRSTSGQMRLFNQGETISRGWVLTQSGQVAEGLEMMARALDTWEQSRATRHFPHYQGMLAEGYALAGAFDEALVALRRGLDFAVSSGERYFEAELHRLEGETLLRQSAARAQEAETCFREAIAVARAQQAKSWELRAALSLGRLLHRQGRPAEAKRQLAAVYGWFSEGFDTPDLAAARQLLEIRSPGA